MDDLPPTMNEERRQPEGEVDVAFHLGGLLDDFREIGAPEPGSKLAAVMRARLLRRAQVRGSLAPRDVAERVQAYWLRLDSLLRRSVSMRILLALLIVVFVLAVALPRVLHELARETSVASLIALEGEKRLVVPVDDRKAGEPVGPAAEAERLTWLASENDLRRLRSVCDERGKVALRRRLLHIGGSDSRTRERIRALARDVAADLAGVGALESYADVEALSLGLRALLASGSTTMRGPHHRVVRAAMRRIEKALPELHGAELATALAGYLEGALVTGSGRLLTAESRVDRLAAELRRFTDEQFELLAERPATPLGPVVTAPRSVFHYLPRPYVRSQSREVAPAMAQWACPLGALADAGQLLRVAPALGVSPTRAARVRSAFHTHLYEARGYRVARSSVVPRSGAAAAAARAALLFSYGDMSDREALRQSLRGYCVEPDRFGRDIRAVHFLAWSVFPGAGWARFNQALRYMTANYRVEAPVERAGLLLVQLLYTGQNHSE